MDRFTNIFATITTGSMNTALTVLYIILGILVLGSISLTLAFHKTKHISSSRKFLLGVCYVVTLAVIVCTVLCVKKSDDIRNQLTTPPSTSQLAPDHETTSDPTEEPTTEPTTEPT